MDKKPRLWLVIGASLLLCAFFTSIFVCYSQPMESKSYDLSLIAEISEVESADMSEERGWTLFTQEGENVQLLSYDGMGSFQTLSYAGQTVYFSRVMTEALDAPTIQLASVNRNFAVFLNGDLIYTDCPELDNRIGYLTLPMREWDRKENLTISLPEDYVGKTLTIAQSTSEYAETPRMATRFLPVPVTLYCGYAYESSLIAESFQTAVIGAASFVLGMLLLAIFLRQFSLGHFEGGLFFLALAVFLSMTAYMYDTSYSWKYFGNPYPVSITQICRLAGIASLLAFLSSKAPRLRPLHWVVTGLYAVFNLVFCLLLSGNRLSYSHPVSIFLWRTQELLGGFALLFMLLFSFLFRRYSPFHRVFAPLTAAGCILYLAFHLALPSRGTFFSALATALCALSLNTLAFQLASLMAVIAILLILVQTIRQEIALYAEKHLIQEMRSMAQQRYENLRAHYEEVMSLRHDMNRHFTLLRQMTTEEKPAQYLDELIGQNKKVRPVIQSGNEMIDIILSSRLNTAIDTGLHVEIIRAAAPNRLPLTDADLCSLIMNLFDNALEAARNVAADQPFIRLDLHIKNNFFVFICENSADMHSAETPKEEAVPKHGLGLKIVRQIADRYDILLQTEYGVDYYKVSLAIPLHQPSK